MNPVSVTPVAPIFHNITVCGTTGSIAIPQTTGVKYTLNGNDFTTATTVTGLQGSQTVTASAQPGYTLSGTTSWTQDVGTLYPCATPAAPTFVPIATCGVYGQVIINATTGVVYKMGASVVSGTLTGLQGSVTITAEPASGYGFPMGTTTSWSGSLGTFKQCATANEPPYTPITACNTWGVFTMPSDTVEVAWSIVPSVPVSNHWAGTYTLTATAKTGYAFAGLAPTKVFTLTFGSWFPCNSGTVVAPIFHAINTCGAYGTIELPAAPVEGVIYVHNSTQYTSGTITGNLAGSQEVTVIAAPGYVLTGPVTWPWTGNLGTFKQCATANEPPYTPITGCNSWGVFTMPADNDEVAWTLDPAAPVDNHWEGTFTLTATAKAGYAFTPLNPTKSFTLSFGTWSACDAGTVVPPVFLKITTCGVYGAIKLPDVAIEGVIYEHDGIEYTHGTITGNLEGTHEVSVKAADGYTLSGSDLGPWSDDLGVFKQCATANAPSYTPITACNTWGVFTLPSDTADVAWSIAPPAPLDGHWAGNFTVTATAKAGYAFTGLAATKTFPLMFGTWFPCNSGTVIPPVFQPIASCGVYGFIKLPDDPTEGVIYVHNGTQYTSGTISGNLAGSQEVTVVAAPGYTLTGPVTWPWEGDLGAFTQCATPEAPTVTSISACGVFGSVLFKTTTGVSYAITAGDGQQGLVTITASPLAGYSFPSGAQTTFTFNLGSYAPCAGSIGNRVWNDTDGDGVQDSGEPGVAGVVVELYRAVGSSPAATALLTTTTDGDGLYNFPNLSTVTGLDKYFVRYILPAGYGFTTPNVGADSSDSDANPETGYTALIDLDSGENDANEDAGIYRAALEAAKFSIFDETVKGTALHLEGKSIVVPYNSKDEEWQITSRFVLTNSGTVTLDIDSLVDDVLGTIECAAADTPLAPGASITCEGSEAFANKGNENVILTRASVTGKSSSALATDHAEASDSASYTCLGNELYGRWYYETSATFNGFTPGQDFLFKDAPANLVPAALKNAELPVFLSLAGRPESESRVVFSKGGLFQLSNLEVGQAMTYTLRVGDDALTPLGYGPVGSSLRFNVKAENCASLTFDIGYAKSGGVMGGFVWYDVNKNGVKDEWFDANDDGEITLNNDAGANLDENGFVSMPVGDFEFFDINGNGTPDLPGELNECGLRSVGPTVELFDIDNNLLDSTVAGNTGFYRFRTLIDPESNQERPLDPQTSYGLRLPAAVDNPLLTTGGAEMEAMGLCKSRPDLEIAEPLAIWSAGADPAPKCGSTSVPVLVRKLADYAGGIALDANFGVACVRDDSEPGLRTIWLPVIRINE